MENYKLPAEIEYMIQQMDKEIEISLYRFRIRLDNHMNRLKDPGGYDRLIDSFIEQLKSNEVIGISESDERKIYNNY